MTLEDVRHKKIKSVAGQKYVCVKIISPTTFYKVGTVIMHVSGSLFTNRLPENAGNGSLRISDGIGGFDGLWAIYAPTLNESLEDYM